nr:hypothetical protein Iba_chr12cCG7560 [Ipomoea batatas]
MRNEQGWSAICEGGGDEQAVATCDGGVRFGVRWATVLECTIVETDETIRQPSSIISLFTRPGRGLLPLGVQYLVASPGTAHLVHAEVSRDNQEALILFLPPPDGNFCSPCCWGQHEEYNLDQSTHSIHAVASCRQAPCQAQLPSA